MKVECPHCRKVYNIPDERLPKREKISFPCPACKGMIELAQQTTPPERPASAEEEGAGGEGLKKRILKAVKDLPPMPQTVFKAQSVMRDPNAGFKELAAVLETDQALAAKVLRLANSPFYSLSGKVSSLQHASVVLGQRTLEELIAVAGTSEFLGAQLKGYGLNSGDLWQHSIGVAYGAKSIAKKKKPALINDAFSAGLIHDTGKLALDPYVLEKKEAFEAFISRGLESFTSAEKQILGFDHAEIASALCSGWNVPESLIRAIAYHHEPSRSEGDELAYIVHTADAIAMMSGIGAGFDGMQYALDPQTFSVLHMREEEVNEVMVEIVEAVHRISEQMEGA